MVLSEAPQLCMAMIACCDGEKGFWDDYRILSAESQ